MDKYLEFASKLFKVPIEQLTPKQKKTARKIAFSYLHKNKEQGDEWRTKYSRIGRNNV